jgi:hypothetical protein
MLIEVQPGFQKTWMRFSPLGITVYHLIPGMFRSIVVYSFFASLSATAMAQPAAQLSVSRDHIADLRMPEPRHHYLVKPHVIRHISPKLKEVKDSIAGLQAPGSRGKRKKASLEAPHLAGSFLGSAIGGSPNDNHLAVSKDGIVLGIQNRSVYAFRENGEQLFFKSLRAFAGMASIDLKLFDPRVVYDAWEDRFIVLFLSGSTYESSRLVLAFSQTPDPSAAWNVYTINGNPLNDDTWSDFPTLAVSRHDVLITTNSFYNGSVNNSGKKQSLIWRISKAGGFGGTSLDIDVYDNLKFNNTYLFNFTPSSNHFNDGQPLLFLSNDALQGGNRFYVAQLSDDKISIRQITASVPYMVPPDARQRGGDRKLNTNDSRILDATMLGDDIHFALNTASPEFRPAIYYGIIKAVGTPAETIDALVISDEMEIAFPSLTKVSADGGDVVMMLYLHSSPDHFPGCSAIYLRPMEGGIALSEPLRIQQGQHPLAYWGDYTKIVISPRETGTAWISASFGLNDDSGTVTLESATVIGKITTGLVTSTAGEGMVKNTELYPNPVKTSFTLNILNKKPETIRILIVNNNNQVVFEAHEKIGSSGTYTFFMNADFLPDGLYVMRIYDSAQVISTEKFIVAK